MNSITNAWYEIDKVEQLDSPALVVYLERIKANIELAKSMIGDPARLRPHVKTNKCKEAVLLMMDAGISKFKCATIAEAEMCGMCKAPDVLLAYQAVGPKLARFISLVKQYPQTKFSCLIDNEETAEHISEKALENDIQITVFIDLNVGMNRTGIPPQNALQLYKNCHSLNGLNIVGVHAYDGQIYDSSLEIRTIKCNEAFKPVEDLRKQLIMNGLDAPIIVAGGSPTFPIHAKRTGIECSPGTFIFWDKGYSDLFPDMKFLPAALLVTRIISLLDETNICLDLGHKSVASENELQHRVFFLNEPGLKIISQNEEHLVAQLPANHNKKVGDLFYGIPIHICPTVALYEKVFVIHGHKLVNEWQIIARNRKISI
jgi:D-serine deaminase-like pyridoxal phosphate-dependent protein